MLERFQTGKQLEPALERWWHAGWGQDANQLRDGRETSTCLTSLALYERKDDVKPSEAVCPAS
jgi:hypothetical protein